MGEVTKSNSPLNLCILKYPGRNDRHQGIQNVS